MPTYSKIRCGICGYYFDHELVSEETNGVFLCQNCKEMGGKLSNASKPKFTEINQCSLCTNFFDKNLISFTVDLSEPCDGGLPYWLSERYEIGFICPDCFKEKVMPFLKTEVKRICDKV